MKTELYLLHVDMEICEKNAYMLKDRPLKDVTFCAILSSSTKPANVPVCMNNCLRALSINSIRMKSIQSNNAEMMVHQHFFT